MSEPTIEQMNEVIAIFDGWEKRPERIIDPEKNPFYYLKHGFTYRWISDFHYHSSWDVLMPVWKKLRESILSDFKGKYPMKLLAAQRRWKNCCAGVSIDVAHSVVYELIQWYNKQKQ